ncbi:MAG TPA: hypothetical protein VND93_17795 [Myxococcales bacterium]|nr:hypothetical protein [Myxococcales bacterium]
MTLIPNTSSNPIVPATQGAATPAPGQPAPTTQAAPAGAGADAFQPKVATSYAAMGGAPPRGAVRQDTPRGCGEAAVATVVRQMGGQGAGQAPSQLMRDLEARFDRNRDGTTPAEMVDMLGHVGLSATRATSYFDPSATDAALASGGRVLLLADSVQIRPGGAGAQGGGAAHWVVLDGKDARGHYTVSDPLDGSCYSAAPGQVSRAMDASWHFHRGGGMLVVQPSPADQGERVLADGVRASCSVMGTEPGIGSNGVRFGQEGN